MSDALRQGEKWRERDIQRKILHAGCLYFRRGLLLRWRSRSFARNQAGPALLAGG